MKFAKHLIALAAVAAAVAVPMSAQAESDVNTVSSVGQSASARLNFRVTVPKVIYLQVGTGTAFSDVTTVDEVLFSLTAGQVTTPGAVAASGAGVTARILGNGGNVSLTALGAAGGLVNTPMSTSIAWSEITGTSSSASLPHPAIGNGVAGAASSLTAVAGIVNQTATWTFSYANAASVAAGDYTGQVTYTAALP
jgi:hypothetical protein